MKPVDPLHPPPFSAPGSYVARGFREAPAPILAPIFMERAIADGIPKERLRRVAELVTGDSVEATRLMHAIVPKSSLSRRDTLTPAQGEQTERLSRLFGYAVRIFGDVEAARVFMRRPHPELDDRRPIDAALSELGGRAVERVLDSLAFGLPV